MPSGDASTRNTPAAEVQLTPEFVHRLLTDQHPDLARLALVELASGWDNAMYRLGEDLTVRVPRRKVAAPLIEHEQRWLPSLARRLPLPIPAPVRMGRPTDYYPWPWSVLPWLPGHVVGNNGWDDPMTAAKQLGGFLAALHTPAPENSPPNPHRGGPLGPRNDMTVERIALLSDRIDADAARAAWAESVAADPWAGPPIWLHGDMHPFNLLQDGGRASAVIDFGDICGGDPACDLAIAFSGFPPEARDGLRHAAANEHRAIDDAMWLRARGWCLSVGTAVLAFSDDNPVYQVMGGRMIAAGSGR